MIKDGYKKTSIGYIPLDWEVKKFKDITAILRCGLASTPKYVEDGVPFLSAQNVKNGKLNLDKYKCISNELHEKLTKNTKPQKNDILMTRVGNVGDAALVDIDWEFSVYVSLTHIRMKEGYDSQFFTQLLNSSFIKRRSLQTQYKGGGVANLNVKVVEEFDMPIPPLKEQQKIAEILSSVDAAIEKTEQVIAKTEEVKKGLMQQLLTKGIGHTKFKQTDIGNIPIKWKLLTLESLCERVTRKNKSLNDNVLTISAQHGLINQAEFFNKIVAGKNIESYYLLKQGEFAYNKSYSKGYPFGVIRRLDRYEEGILSTLYICFKLKDEQTVTSDFINNIFESGLLDSQFVGIAKEGARAHGLLNIKVADFFNIQIPIPSLEEQNKISEVIKVMNIRIDSEEIKLKKLNEVKKGLMQQLLTGKTRVKID